MHIPVRLFRWRLQKAFYTEESIGACGCAGIGWYDYFPGSHFCMPSELEHQRIPNDQMGPLCLADLEDIKPQYISNIVVNEWRREAQDQLAYDLMTMSPTEIERIDCPPQCEEFSGKLKPMDIKLSDAMATSAAAVSPYMGAYEQSTEPFKHLQTILGLGMGESMVSDMTFEKRESCWLKASRFILLFFFSHIQVSFTPSRRFRIHSLKFLSFFPFRRTKLRIDH